MRLWRSTSPETATRQPKHEARNQNQPPGAEFAAFVPTPQPNTRGFGTKARDQDEATQDTILRSVIPPNFSDFFHPCGETPGVLLLSAKQPHPERPATFPKSQVLYH